MKMKRGWIEAPLYDSKNIYTLPSYSFDSVLFLADTGVHLSFLKPFKMCMVDFRMDKMERVLLIHNRFVCIAVVSISIILYLRAVMFEQSFV